MKKTNALRILDQAKVAYQVFEYKYGDEEDRVEKLLATSGLSRAQIYKTLVAKGDKQGIFVAIVPIDGRLNYKAASKVSGNKKSTLTPLKDLTSLTGYLRGGCSPLGMKKNYPTYMDESALTHSEILVNAGQRGLLMRVDPAALIRVTDATVAAIAE